MLLDDRFNRLDRLRQGIQFHEQRNRSGQSLSLNVLRLAIREIFGINANGLGEPAQLLQNLGLQKGARRLMAWIQSEFNRIGAGRQRPFGSSCGQLQLAQQILAMPTHVLGRSGGIKTEHHLFALDWAVFVQKCFAQQQPA